MSYTFLQERGEESSAESFSDIPAYVLSRLNLTADKSCCNASVMASSQSFQSGMMCEPSTATPGEEGSMSYAVGSRAKTYRRHRPSGTSTVEFPAQGAACGGKWRGLLVRFNHDLFSSKTVLCSEQEDSMSFSRMLPKWGTMRDGELSPLRNSAHRTRENECGFCVPTPCKSDANGAGRNSTSSQGYGEKDCLKNYMSIRLRWLYPPVSIAEWLMGWPIGWTGLKPLETGKFQSWLRLHSKP